MFNSGDLYRLPGGKRPALVYINDPPKRKPMLVDLYDEAVANSEAMIEVALNFTDQ